ncbi:DUF4097 family beta strand repeat protein [candidate division KSB1 bacterium]|nr:DUF4097 family beta strand repeat protein [candidate division KSB1 bacterium]
MKKMIAVIALLVPALIFAQELKKEGRYYVAEITKEFDVDKGGSLVMEDVQGDVTITTWNKNTVSIYEIRRMDVFTKAEAEAVLKESQAIYKKDGNTIRIGGADSYRSYMNSKFEIKLPAEFDVDVGTRGGDVSVTSLKGTTKIRTSGGDIELIKVNGDVQAKTSGGDVKIVENTKQAQVKTSGGDVEILDVYGEVQAKTSGGDIIIKNNKARVEAKTSGGDVMLENVGAEVEVATSGGDIEVDGSAGDIEVATSGGDVELMNIKGQAKARTSGGDIEANTVLKGVDVSTSGGDIELKDIQGFIDASTSGGDIEAEMTLKDFSKDHHVELKSSGGNITLWIPDKLPATIKAEIKLTGFASRTKEYNVYSDFPLESEDVGDEENYRGEFMISKDGKINGGGDLIYLRTTNGNINIRKLQ